MTTRSCPQCSGFHAGFGARFSPPWSLCRYHAGKVKTGSEATLAANVYRPWWRWKYTASSKCYYRVLERVDMPVDYRWTVSTQDQERRIANGQIASRDWIRTRFHLDQSALVATKTGTMVTWFSQSAPNTDDVLLLTPPLHHFVTLSSDSPLKPAISNPSTSRLLVQPELRRAGHPLSGIFVVGNHSTKHGESMLGMLPYQDASWRTPEEDGFVAVALDSFLSAGKPDARFGADGKWPAKLRGSAFDLRRADPGVSGSPVGD